MKIAAPSFVKKVTDALRGAGYSAYLVGGCVRDSLLGEIPHDYDVATNALPEEMKRAFSGFRTVETGIEHGTLTVISDGEPVEVTTFRIDGEYSDGRHPDGVRFTDGIEPDLSRRDFTVNAMAYSDGEGLIDLFGGEEHLRQKLIACVGEPDERFGEDGLRVLRALRFASRLDFTVEEKTAESVRRSVSLLMRVSAERIYSELTRLLVGPGAARIMREFPCVIGAVTDVPEDAVIRAADAADKTEKDHITRLALLFAEADLDRDGTAERMRKLKTSRADREDAAAALRLSAEPLPDAPPAMRRLLGAVGAITVRRAADIRSSRGDRTAKDAAALAEEILSRGDPVKISDLAVKGGDIRSVLPVEGKEIGEVLEKLLFLVTEEKVKNDRDDLLAAAKEMK
ncbi:MAG: polynucleotide adenylyltransferase [Clostridia bacterium]|nr:polynucleotide adenylyltransferase [Clostridia bacterium]